MNPHPFRHVVRVAALLATTACATVRPEPGGPLDGPLPPGTYELTAHVTYRADSEQNLHDAYASFTVRLFASIDGSLEMYSGSNRCVDPLSLPGVRARRPWQGGNPGHHFSCGNSGWTVWADHEGKVMARASTTVTEMVQSKMKCLTWQYGNGHQTCIEYGVEVNPRTTTVRAAAEVKKVG